MESDEVSIIFDVWRNLLLKVGKKFYQQFLLNQNHSIEYGHIYILKCYKAFNPYEYKSTQSIDEIKVKFGIPVEKKEKKAKLKNKNKPGTKLKEEKSPFFDGLKK